MKNLASLPFVVCSFTDVYIFERQQFQCGSISLRRKLCPLPPFPSSATQGFRSWLAYKIEEEKSRTQQKEYMFEEDEEEEQTWLKVLELVRAAVLEECAKRKRFLLDCVWYNLRLKEEDQRKRYIELVSGDLDDVQVLDLRKLVDNVASSVSMEEYKLLREDAGKILELKGNVEEIIVERNIDLNVLEPSKHAPHQKSLGGKKLN